MEFKPHPYQQYCLDRILEQKKVGLFLDMGLGKTVVTLSAVLELKYMRFQVNKVLVVAPKKVAEGTWNKEGAKWDHTQMLRLSNVLGTAKQRVKALEADADIYIINRDNVVWITEYYKQNWPFDMVVLDESSSFKNPAAKRFKAMARVSPRINRLVELTGTPSPNGLEDLWSQIYLLDQGERLEKRFSQYRMRYFIPDRRGAYGQVYTYKLIDGAEETIMKRISDICVSMKAEDYIELPDLIEHTIPVVLSPAEMKTYREMEREMIIDLPDEAEISATSAAALSGKLLQLANGAVYDETHSYHEIHSAKIEAFLELIESLQGKPAIVFYSFQHDRDRLLLALGKHCKGLRVRYLSDPQDETDWNEGRIDILLAHPASCGYGLNLQEGGNHVIWFGLTWAYELYVQANDRLHRQGQTEKVIVHHLVCVGTRDEDVVKALALKDKAQGYVIESLKARIKDVKDGKI